MRVVAQHAAWTLSPWAKKDDPVTADRLLGLEVTVSDVSSLDELNRKVDEMRARRRAEEQ